MKWTYTIGTFEITLILLFIAFYCLYVWRVIRINRQLHQAYYHIIFKLFIRTLYIGLLIISLLGPSFGEGKKEIRTVGKDIFICIDLSQSMNATDIQPTRLAKVKFELKNIVKAFGTDRIGLIIFSGEAYMQCPLTYDNNALNLFIQTLNTSLVPNYGTDFGPPLDLALTKMTEEYETSAQNKSKIIILISDGEDFGENTNEVSSKIKNEEIKLFTLGIGTPSGSKLPSERGFKRNKSGEVIISKLNSRSLRNLAKDTGGKYFEINESKNDVKRLINTIDQLEGELREARQIDAKQNRYYYFLTLAFVLMLLDILLSIKVIKL